MRVGVRCVAWIPLSMRQNEGRVRVIRCPGDKFRFIEMEKIRLEIIGMSYSQSQSGAYALILGEKDGKRRLSQHRLVAAFIILRATSPSFHDELLFFCCLCLFSS